MGRGSAAVQAAYVALSHGASGCPVGTEVANPEECAEAIVQLGTSPEPVALVSMSSIPRFCTLRESVQGSGEHMHFNNGPTGRGRSDLAPVCKARAVRREL